MLRKIRRLFLRIERFITSDRFIIGYGFLVAIGGVAVAFGVGFTVFFVVVFAVPALFFVLAIVMELPAIRRLALSRSGVRYKECEFDFRISEEGDFIGRFYYCLVNDSEQPLQDLPSEGWVWFSEPTASNISYKVINDPNGGKLHGFQSNGHSITNAVVSFLSRNPHELRFNYAITPQLDPGETLKYEIIVRTLKTELAAFSDKGTYWGFPAMYPIDKVQLTLSAPEQHRIEITKPVIIWNSNRTQNQPEKEKICPGPKLNRSATIANWYLEDVGPNDRYWSGYKLVKEEFSE